MLKCDPEWLRHLADLVEKGECEVGRVEMKHKGVILGVFEAGTFAKKEKERERNSDDS